MAEWIPRIDFIKSKQENLVAVAFETRDDPEILKHYKIENNRGCPCQPLANPNAGTWHSLTCITTVNKSTRNSQESSTKVCPRCGTCIESC